jgi:hypothetical protein
LGVFSYSQSQEIPREYLGNYKGELKIYTPEIVSKLDMELEISSTDTLGKYNYVLRYLSDQNPDIRNYTLIAKDSLKNQFILDENNGIKIPTTYVNNTLQSFFQVESSLLATKISFQKDLAVFEISVANTKQADSTATYSGEFMVLGYPVSVYQKALLKKE